MDFEKNMNFISYILSKTHTLLKVQLPAGQGINAPEKRSADFLPILFYASVISLT